MAISKAKKNQKVEVLTRELENSTTAIVTPFPSSPSANRLFTP